MLLRGEYKYSKGAKKYSKGAKKHQQIFFAPLLYLYFYSYSINVLP